MQRYRVAMAQMLVEGGQAERNLDRAETTTDRAARDGCQIVAMFRSKCHGGTAK